MSKNAIKLIGVVVISVIASLLLTFLGKELDVFSYFSGVIIAFWLWSVEEVF